MEPKLTRTAPYGNQRIEQDVDAILRRMREYDRRLKTVAGGLGRTGATGAAGKDAEEETIRNNSGAQMNAYYLYGLGSGGAFAAASHGSVEALVQVKRNIAVDTEGPVRRGGSSVVVLEDPAAGVTAGASLYLSATAGKVTPNNPGDGRVVATAISPTVAADGTVPAWLNLPSMQTVNNTTAAIKDHGALTGLADDDHTQYLNNTRHDTTDRHALGTVVPHDDHTALSNVGSNTHAEIDTAVAASASHIAATSGIVHGLTLTDILLVDGSRIATLFKTDNIQLDGNTISTLNANGNLILAPKGTGKVGVGGTPIRLFEVYAGGTLVPGNSTNLYLNFAALQDHSAYRGLQFGYDLSGVIGLIASVGIVDFRAFTGGNYVRTMRIDNSGNVGILGDLYLGNQALTSGTINLNRYTVFAGPATSAKTFTLPNANAILAAVASAGTNGQILYRDSTAATGFKMDDPPAAGDILPDQTGNSGKFLTTNGSAASWAAVENLTLAIGAYEVNAT